MFARASFLSLQSSARIFRRLVNTSRPYRVSGATSWLAKPNHLETCSRVLCTSVRQEHLDTDEKKTLFVGTLRFGMTENHLRDHFSQYGEIDTLHIMHTKMTKRPKHAFLTFKNDDVVDKVLQESHELGGYKIFVDRGKPKNSKQGSSTCFVQLQKISPEISKEDVVKHFCKYGEVVAVDWPVDPSSNVRRDYCFVQLSSEEEAEEAAGQEIQVLGTCKEGVEVRKSYSSGNYKSTNKIMLHPPDDVTVESLFDHFSKFGKIWSISGLFYSVDVSRHAKPIFWIHFEDAGSVLEAVKQTNMIDGQVVPTMRTKPEKLKSVAFPMERKVFVDGLPLDVSMETLIEYFREFGEVESCSFVRDPVTELDMNWCLVVFNRLKDVNALIAKRQHQIGGKDVRIRRVGWRQDPLSS